MSTRSYPEPHRPGPVFVRVGAVVAGDDPGVEPDYEAVLEAVESA